MKRSSVILVLCGLLLAGCTELSPKVEKKQALQSNAELAAALAVVGEERQKSPYNADLLAKQQRLRETLVDRYLQEAKAAAEMKDFARAAEMWNSVLQYQSGNALARQGLSRIDSWRALERIYQQALLLRQNDPQQALMKIQQVLEEDPNWPQAAALRDFLMREIAVHNSTDTRLKHELRKPVTLNFREHSLMTIFDTISKMTGISIIYDKDVSTSMTASIVARQTTAEDAINLLLLSNQLRKKVLNENSLLIYPATAQKEKQYSDIVVKTIFLGYARAKDVNIALRNMVKLKDVHVDERTNSITVRGPKEKIEQAERLLVTLDRPEAEVMLAVEVLEINSQDMEDLGIEYPKKIGVGLFTDKDQGNNIPLKGINGSNLFINTGQDTLVTLQLNKLRSHANVLANPRIRVKNAKKALIDIGEQIPVVTSTISDNYSQEKVEYQDVGLKLEVTPEISVDGSITMDVNFNLSSQGTGERGKEGVIYYRKNNREAKTVLSSQNGETQMLAGLIKQEDKKSDSGIPWLSDIPGVGRLFGSKSNSSERSEVILLITPTIEHNLDLPGSHVSTIAVGAEELPGSQTILRGIDKIQHEQFDAPLSAPSARFPRELPAPTLTKEQER